MTGTIASRAARLIGDGGLPPNPTRGYYRCIAAVAPISPGAWVDRLGGADLLQARPRRWHGVGVGLWSFGELPDRVTLPGIDMHYISFTVRGPLHVERDTDEGRVEADFRPGHSLIIAAGRENTWRWDRPTDELHLYVDPAFLADVAAEAGFDSPELIERFAFEDPFLRQATRLLADEMREPQTAGDLFAESTGHAIALHLLRTHCAMRRRDVRRPGGLSPAQLRHVRALIDEDITTSLTLEVMAAAAGVTRAHFARGFKASTGVSPHRFLIERRLERARQLLAASTQPVGEIAHAVGFASQSHFTTTFTRHVGVSPTTYRDAL